MKTERQIRNILKRLERDQKLTRASFEQDDNYEDMEHLKVLANQIELVKSILEI